MSGARRTAARPLLGVPATGAESRPDLRFLGSRVLLLAQRRAEAWHPAADCSLGLGLLTNQRHRFQQETGSNSNYKVMLTPLPAACLTACSVVEVVELMGHLLEGVFSAQRFLSL